MAKKTTGTGSGGTADILSTTGELHIHDGNWEKFAKDTRVAGQIKKRGAIPRPYATTHYSFEKPGLEGLNIKNIPKSEWSDRLRQKQKDQAQLSDIRNQGMHGQRMPSRDQNGRGYCHTADTEVLTEKGWVMWPDYDWTTALGTVNPLTHRLEFQRPFEKHVYDYDGPMVYSTNRRVDFGVTPDHQMLVRKWDHPNRTLASNYSTVRAADIGWYAGLMHAPAGQRGTEFVEVEVPGDRRYKGDDLIALMGLIVSDGYAGGSEKTRNWVSFASFREETREQVAALAHRTGFHEMPSRRGVWIRYNAGVFADWIREHCYIGGTTGAKSKKVPAFIKHASRKQIKLFLHWFDDRSRDSKQFYSTSRQLIDDLQELHLRISIRSTIGHTKAKETVLNDKTIRTSPAFILHVGETESLCISRKKHIETERYRGPVYCAAVPNHSLVTRRNGTTLISSNCWFHSGTSALLIVRAKMNLAYADLSAYSGACKIKNFRDEGGWGAQGLDFLCQYGVCDSSAWPQQGTSRSLDTPAAWENAKQYRFIEAWNDLAVAQYDRSMTFEQVATCLLNGIPVIVDFNWWSHSVCAIDLVEVSSGSFGLRIWNSWSDGWSEGGTGVLSGSRAIPDGATAPREALAIAA